MDFISYLIRDYLNYFLEKSIKKCWEEYSFTSSFYPKNKTYKFYNY